MIGIGDIAVDCTPKYRMFVIVLGPYRHSLL